MNNFQAVVRHEDGYATSFRYSMVLQRAKDISMVFSLQFGRSKSPSRRIGLLDIQGLSTNLSETKLGAGLRKQ